MIFYMQLQRKQIKLLKGINPQKTNGFDKIPPNVIKFSAKIIDPLFTNTINKDIDNNRCSGNAKIASVSPSFKNKGRHEVENQKPVSILNCITKIQYKKYTLQTFKFISEFISAYSENYNPRHIFIRLFENWKKSLDKEKGFVTSAVLTDLSKVFDCIPHDLLAAKLYAYDISLNAASFIYIHTLNVESKK